MLAMEIGTEIQSAEDTVMMQRTSVDPAIIALRAVIGLGLLDVPTVDIAVNVIAMIVIAGKTDAVGMAVIEKTRILDLGETTGIGIVTGVAATTGREETLIPTVETAMIGVIKTRTEPDLRVLLPDDVLHLHAQQKIAVTAAVNRTAAVTRTVAAIIPDETTATAFMHPAETVAHRLPAP